jgi:hypothetical protein
MATMRFYLDQRSDMATRPVCLVVYHDGERKIGNALMKHLRIRIPVSMWNSKNDGNPELVKGNTPEALYLRDKLKEIKHLGEVVIPNQLYSQGAKVTPEAIFNKLLIHYGKAVGPVKEIVNLKLLNEIIGEYIKIKSPTYSFNTIQNYKMAKKHLLDYAEKHDEKLTITDIGIPWMAKFVNYLCAPCPEGAGLENASVVTMLQTINAAARYFDHPGWSRDKLVGHLRVFKNEETDTIQLSLQDIIKIYKFDCCIGGNVKIGWLKVRDLFVWSFFTGHRHNELYQLSKHSIDYITDISGNKHPVISYVSDKTGKPNQAVLNPICMEIIERWKDINFEVVKTQKKTKEKIIYPDSILPVVNLYTCNNNLEDILEEIAFRESVATYGPEFSRGKMDLYEPVSFYRKQLKVRYMGATRKEEYIPLYKYITFKTSRRSLASELADSGLTDGDISSVLNNDPETARKYYAKRDRTIANIRTTEILTNKANELMEKKKAGS